MHPLSPADRRSIDELARRHGFGVDATLAMLEAIVGGNGTMAQFDHPEFAGPGQWMHGGMTMVSDMFNDRLKGRVDALCRELAQFVARQAPTSPAHGGGLPLRLDVDPPAHAPAGSARELLATIEGLAALHARGILGDDEFALKKTDLLSRV